MVKNSVNSFNSSKHCHHGLRTKYIILPLPHMGQFVHHERCFNCLTNKDSIANRPRAVVGTHYSSYQSTTNCNAAEVNCAAKNHPSQSPFRRKKRSHSGRIHKLQWVIISVGIPVDPIANGISLSKPSDIGVVVSRSVIVEVTIGIELFAGELSGVIAGPCLSANSTKNKEDKVAIRCVPLRCR